MHNFPSVMEARGVITTAAVFGAVVVDMTIGIFMYHSMFKYLTVAGKIEILISGAGAGALFGALGFAIARRTARLVCQHATNNTHHIVGREGAIQKFLYHGGHAPLPGHGGFGKHGSIPGGTSAPLLFHAASPLREGGTAGIRRHQVPSFASGRPGCDEHGRGARDDRGQGIIIPGRNVSRRALIAAVGAAAIFAARVVLEPAPVLAITDPGKIGMCVINECRAELGRCLVNPKCFANLICINSCNNRPDETECQIKCGDLFENEVVGEFNACAVSQKKCVPRRQDDGTYPPPPEEAIVSQFKTSSFEGQWYIAAGLNPVFDTFDCQVHFFKAPSPDRLYGKLNWRIEEPDGEFFTRRTVQEFKQDPARPGVLYNHDNEYLHYEDDWYILDYSEVTDPVKNPDAFILVYYRGRNDAWDGYGGAVLYTRSKVVPNAIRSRVADACARANIDFENFRECDNLCAAEGNPTLLREDYANRVLLTSEEELAAEATRIRQNAASVGDSVSKEVVEIEQELQDAVKRFEKTVEANSIGKLVAEYDKLLGRTPM